MAWYLRVEGVNLDATILDTPDLSTIRGSSLLFLNIINELDQALLAKYAATPVTLGASIGIWLFDGSDQTIVADDVCQWLNGTKIPPLNKTDKKEQTALQHAGLAVFTVVTAPQTENYLNDRETLLALGRRQQMRVPTIVYPDPGIKVKLPPKAPALIGLEKGKTENWVCELDMIRPRADDAVRIKGEWKWVSDSVRERRKYGVLAKQNYYHDVMEGIGIELCKETLPDADTLPFALHFESLTAPESDGPSANKIAVLYIDGNKFSKQERNYIKEDCGDAGKSQLERQTIFDKQVQEFRANYLATLLEMMPDKNGCGKPTDAEISERKALKKKYPNINTESVIRMETLLWGGDDLMIILPAHLGWRAAQILHDQTQNYLGNGPWKIGTHEMHHAAGLIFCHHTAPIHRIKQLAKNLCRDAKGDAKGKGRDESRLAYMVLESFDLTGGDTSNYWYERCHNNFGMKHFVIKGNDLDKIDKMIAALKKKDFAGRAYPNRRVRNLAAAIHRANCSCSDFNAIAKLKKLEDASCEQLQPLKTAHEAAYLDFGDKVKKALDQGFGEDTPKGVRWLIIEDLWDYLALHRKGDAS